MSVEVARKEARRLLAEFALGLDVVAQAPAPTLQEVLDRYLIERTMKNQTRKSYRSLCNRSIGDWLGLPITEITPAMVQERHKDLVRPTRCGTDNKGCANTVMWLLNSLMKFAACTYEVDGKPLLENSPVRRLSQVRQWYKKESRQGLMPDNKLADFYRAIMNRIASARRQFT